MNNYFVFNPKDWTVILSFILRTKDINDEAYDGIVSILTLKCVARALLLHRFNDGSRQSCSSSMILLKIRSLRILDMIVCLMNNVFFPLLETFCPFFYCPIGAFHRWPGCPDSSSFCPLSSTGQENWCFWVVLGLLCVSTHN